MSFFRSAYGISNRAAFSGKDVSIYVEQDPLHGDAGALDVAHWREFFESFYPGVSVVVVPLGGKQPVLEMAQKIINENIKNAFCALDSDYDENFGIKITDDRIFYTHGYGVENDVINKKSIVVALKSCAPGANNLKDSARKLWEYIVWTTSSCRRLVTLDAIAVARGGAAFSRTAPKSDLEQSKTELPVKIRRVQVRRRANQYRKMPNLRELVGGAPSDRKCIPAHAYFEICYSTFVRHLKSHDIKNYAEEAFVALMIAAFSGNFLACLDDDASEHYVNLGSRDLLQYIE